jgi:RimJ/RimL family protein N-acetyltransferase
VPPLPDPPLGDGVVRLRPPRAGDLDAVVEGCRDPLTQLYTRVPAPYTAEDGRAFIAGAPGRRLLGESLDLAIAADEAGDRLLGMIGIVMDRHDPQRGEIGYWVGPRDRGRGVAGRALALLSRWALTAGGLRRLDLCAAVGNGASLRTAERCGFVREGVLREAWFRGPERTDTVLFSLLPRDLSDPRG